MPELSKLVLVVVLLQQLVLLVSALLDLVEVVMMLRLLLLLEEEHLTVRLSDTEILVVLLHGGVIKGSAEGAMEPRHKPEYTAASG